MERAAILAALAALVVLAVVAARRLAASRSARLLAMPAAEIWHALGEAPDGRGSVIRFSTPACGDCAVQDRILDEMGVRVIRIDASRRPDLARRFGILTAPTTVVLDPAGRVVATNHGLAGPGRLRGQLETAAAA